MLTIISEGLKYGWNPSNKDELYDLERDSHQNKNQIDNPGYSSRLQCIREKMYKHLNEHNNVLMYYFRTNVLNKYYPEKWDKNYKEIIQSEMPLYDRWNYRLEEYTRTRLINKSDTIKFFFEARSVIWNKKVRFVDELILGEKAVEYVNEDQKGGGVLLTTPSVGFLTSPYTKFSVSFKAKVETVEGVPPYINVKERDSNCDFTGNNFELSINDNQRGDWGDYNFEIQTGWKGYSFYFILVSPIGTKINLRMADFTIIQISNSFEMLEISEELINIENHLVNSEDHWEVKLTDNKSKFECITSVTSFGFKGMLKLRYEWFDYNRNVIGEDICSFETEEGIKKEWDALIIKWNRYYGEPIDGIQMGMSRQMSSISGEPFNAENCRVFSGITDSMHSLKISICDDSNYVGQIKINMIRIITY
jgi:hypothetical protein